jgi:ketosteroid isomerase-like protein
MSQLRRATTGGLDPLSVVKTSPELVARHDKEGWLALFTEDATIQDPVGAATYRFDRFSDFWDVFIAPNQVEFIPKRDFVQGDLVIRHVIISVKTAISDDRFEVPAILEYRVAGDRIASLRAFWESRRSVRWYASRGMRGLGGLFSHGARMTSRLGLGPSMAFGRALMPGIPRETAQRLLEELARKIRDDELPDLPRDGRRLGVHPEEIVVAGDHAAAILSSSDRALTAAVIARVDGDRLSNPLVLWA